MVHKAIIGAVLILGACSSANSQAGATHSTGQRDFQVGAFHKIELAGSHDVIVTVGGAPSVRAEGDSEALERLDIRVENGELKVGSNRRGWFSRHHGSVTVHVTVPSLDGASIAGSGNLRVDRAEAESFAASIAGSGDLAIGALRARRANFEIAGSGGIRAAGHAEEADISIAGSGNVSLESLEMRRASVSVAGSGDVSLHATETVDGSLMGSGDLTVLGGARCSVSRMGSGDIHCGT